MHARRRRPAYHRTRSHSQGYRPQPTVVQPRMYTPPTTYSYTRPPSVTQQRIYTPPPANSYIPLPVYTAPPTYSPPRTYSPRRLLTSLHRKNSLKTEPMRTKARQLVTCGLLWAGCSLPLPVFSAVPVIDFPPKDQSVMLYEQAAFSVVATRALIRLSSQTP